MKKHYLHLKPTIWISLLIFLFAFAAFPGTSGAQIFVDTDAADGGDGTTWGSAFNTLQDALDDASSGDQIWVAEGVYFPDEGSSETNNERSSTFLLISGVEIYGGFDGTEASLSERDISAHPTILSGDIDGNDDPFEPDTDSDSDGDTPT